MPAKARHRPARPPDPTPLPEGVAVAVEPLDRFAADPSNPRVHDDRSRTFLASSLSRFGAARSLVADPSGTIRAGAGTLAAARALGIPEAIVVRTDGKRPVIVQRTDWTDAQARAYVPLDNRPSGRDDPASLLARLRACADDPDEPIPPTTLGFSEADLRKLTAAADRAAATGGGPADPDAGFPTVVFALTVPEPTADDPDFVESLKTFCASWDADATRKPKPRSTPP
jgi:hypothetical protein